MEEKIKKLLEVLDKEIELTNHKINLCGVKYFYNKRDCLLNLKDKINSYKNDPINNERNMSVFIRNIIRSIVNENEEENKLKIDINEKLWIIAEIINLNIPLTMKNKQEKRSDRVEKLSAMFNEKGEE